MPFDDRSEQPFEQTIRDRQKQKRAEKYRARQDHDDDEGYDDEEDRHARRYHSRNRLRY